MDRQVVRTILKELPPKRHGSRLDPYVALIRALRRHGRSYRDIMAVLHERCGVRVGLHTLFHFVHTRLRPLAATAARRRRKVSARSRHPTTSAAETHIRMTVGDEVQVRIAALKQRATPAGLTKEFEYDEHEPLQLTAGRSKRGEP